MQLGSFNPDDWAPDSTTDVTGADRLLNIGNTIIGFIRTVGSIASVIVLAVIGIKYMMGSVEEKAEYKQTLLAYLISCAVVFGAFGIWKLVINILSGV